MQDAPSPEANALAHRHILATTVRGTEVFDAESRRLGHIDDVVLDKVSGRAVFAIMSFGGFLGIGEKFHPLPWQSLAYDPALGGYVVNVTRDQLESAPSYGIDEQPDWNDPAYAGQLGAHYG